MGTARSAPSSTSLPAVGLDALSNAATSRTSLGGSPGASPAVSDGRRSRPAHPEHQRVLLRADCLRLRDDLLSVPAHLSGEPCGMRGAGVHGARKGKRNPEVSSFRGPCAHPDRNARLISPSEGASFPAPEGIRAEQTERGDMPKGTFWPWKSDIGTLPTARCRLVDDAPSLEKTRAGPDGSRPHKARRPFIALAPIGAR